MIERRGRRLAGFTLIELMIVVSIIGILASIVIPKYANMVRKAKEGQSLGSLGALRSAMSIYYSDMEGQYPYVLVALTVNGKYLTSIPWLRVPPYHADTTFANNYACNSPCDIIMATSDTAETANQTWWTIEYAGSPANDTSNFGSVWISCTHTDSKGTAWSSY